MSSCYCDDASGTVQSLADCPVSGTAGKRVELLTVKSLLRESALARLSPREHHFCPDPTCDVVYFDGAGATYLRTELRVPVWEKEPPGARMICYCFGENEADMQRELVQTGSTGAVGRVRAHIKAGRCACEIRNPRGVCCLGDLIAAAEDARKDAGRIIT